MIKARDFVNEALEILGVISSGETASFSDINTGLRSLNGMLGYWSVDGLQVYHYTREEFPLVPGQASYTMGSGGDFDTSRPVTIKRVNINYQAVGESAELSVRMINLDQWALQTTKETTSTIPTKVYIETTYPLLTLTLWPVPTEANKLVIYSEKPLETLTDANADLIVPPGYELAIPYNLAGMMAPKFGRSLSPEAAAVAQRSLAAIQIKNIKEVLMTPDPSGAGAAKRFNILTGE